MNKGLELIEACISSICLRHALRWLVHPQSIVHSMVEYLDGSVLRAIGQSGHAHAIAHALGCPDRLVSGVESLDLTAIGRLDFEPPDEVRFLALSSRRRFRRAGLLVVLNAANEVAVGAFLGGRLGSPVSRADRADAAGAIRQMRITYGSPL